MRIVPAALPQVAERQEPLRVVENLEIPRVASERLGEPQYLYEVEDYDRALSTEYGVDVYGRVLRILREQAGVDEA